MLFMALKAVKENICIINRRNLDILVNFVPLENSEVASENVQNTGSDSKKSVVEWKIMQGCVGF